MRYIIIFALVYALPAQAQKTAPPPSDKVLLAIQHLGQTGYIVENTSKITAVNRQAIIAFQKVNKLPRTGTLTDKLISIVLQSNRPFARDSTHELHVEVDLNRQVLYAVDANDHVARILPVSTGNGKYFETPELGGRYALTPRGRFRVYMKVGGWRKSELGLLFDPIYVKNGVAIHGAPSVPPVPASHGCIRIPMFAADEMFRRTPIGTPVIIFGENPKLSRAASDLRSSKNVVEGKSNSAPNSRKRQQN